MKEIREMAERALQPPRRDGGPNPTPQLARFALAVLDALASLEADDETELWAETFRAAIERNMERKP